MFNTWNTKTRFSICISLFNVYLHPKIKMIHKTTYKTLLIKTGFNFTSLKSRKNTTLGPPRKGGGVQWKPGVILDFNGWTFYRKKKKQIEFHIFYVVVIRSCINKDCVDVFKDFSVILDLLGAKFQSPLSNFLMNFYFHICLLSNIMFTSDITTWSMQTIVLMWLVVLCFLIKLVGNLISYINYLPIWII